MVMPQRSKRKPCVSLLASIAMSAVAASSAAVAQQAEYVDEQVANRVCYNVDKVGDAGKVEKDELKIILTKFQQDQAAAPQRLSNAQANYKHAWAKVGDLTKILDKHLAERRKLATQLTEIMNSLRSDDNVTQQLRSLDSQIDTDATELEDAKTNRETAAEELADAQAGASEDASSARNKIADCIKARLDALNKAPAHPSAPPALAHAAPTAPIRTGNAWTCAKDRVEYTEGGKVLPSTSSNDLVVGETTVAVPAYTDRSGSHYPAARIAFTPPKPRYAVGETVVLELNVEGGKDTNRSPGHNNTSQGGAFWFAKEIGGSNMMGGVDAYDRGATCGDSEHESCGD
ncbi:MAG: hypothetical protein KGM97_03935, partial [Alphaproteobacteria bacterium]|nr:hypothetical protein [Alphaproteobacteria bacterium]